uniref:SpoU_methylase domain-containing protein n=1 Tax=Rhabditophanes sp. KR3021 TaxID=114890 RepID=A0AC35UH50_9BILA
MEGTLIMPRSHKYTSDLVKTSKYYHDILDNLIDTILKGDVESLPKKFECYFGQFVNTLLEEKLINDLLLKNFFLACYAAPGSVKKLKTESLGALKQLAYYFDSSCVNEWNQFCKVAEVLIEDQQHLLEPILPSLRSLLENWKNEDKPGLMPLTIDNVLLLIGTALGKQNGWFKHGVVYLLFTDLKRKDFCLDAEFVTLILPKIFEDQDLIWRCETEKEYNHLLSNAIRTITHALEAIKHDDVQLLKYLSAFLTCYTKKSPYSFYSFSQILNIKFECELFGQSELLQFTKELNLAKNLPFGPVRKQAFISMFSFFFNNMNKKDARLFISFLGAISNYGGQEFTEHSMLDQIFTKKIDYNVSDMVEAYRSTLLLVEDKLKFGFYENVVKVFSEMNGDVSLLEIPTQIIYPKLDSPPLHVVIDVMHFEIDQPGQILIEYFEKELVSGKNVALFWNTLPGLIDIFLEKLNKHRHSGPFIICVKAILNLFENMCQNAKTKTVYFKDIDVDECLQKLSTAFYKLYCSLKSVVFTSPRIASAISMTLTKFPEIGLSIENLTCDSVNKKTGKKTLNETSMDEMVELYLYPYGQKNDWSAMRITFEHAINSLVVKKIIAVDTFDDALYSHLTTLHTRAYMLMFFNNLNPENMSKVYGEILAAKILLTNWETIDLDEFLNAMRKSFEIRTGAVACFLNVLTQVFKSRVTQKKEKIEHEFVNKILRCVAPWVTNNNFFVKNSAVHALKIMRQMLNTIPNYKDETTKTVLDIILDDHLINTGNGTKVLKALEDDFYMGQFDLAKHDTIYFYLCILPENLGYPLEESHRDLFKFWKPIMSENCNVLLKSNYEDEMLDRFSEVHGFKGPDYRIPIPESSNETFESVTSDAYQQRKIAVSKELATKEFPDQCIYVIASFIDKPENLGGLCRTSEIFRVDALYLNNLHATTTKSFTALSMSADEWQPLFEMQRDDVLDFIIDQKRNHGFKIVALEQTTGSTMIDDYKFYKKTIIILGDEKLGISAEILKNTDDVVEIRQYGKTRSLNVHVSGAMTLLQDVLATIEGAPPFNLPQITVVGTQSAGKSSVLENIVGYDFLPRGNGIVTRRPLILQLQKADKEYAEFNHKPGKKYTSFEEVKSEIERATDEETGPNKGISAKPIILRIFGPKQTTLTLVDLPGLTKIAVGDQPKDIDKQIRAMVLKEIEKETSIILAVTPANTDLCTSDSLLIASEVDPEHDRTIGVLTKLDLMDHGTDAEKILLNEVYPLHLGFSAIVNRSQKDNNERKTIVDALVSEDEYFNNHPVYKTMRDRTGTKVLQKTLSKQLLLHVKKHFPELCRKINEDKEKVEVELEKYKDITFKDDKERFAKVDTIAFRTGKNIFKDIKSDESDIKSKTTTSELYQLFFSVYDQLLEEVVVDHKMIEEYTENSLMNSNSIKTLNGVNSKTFEYVTKEMIKIYERPSVELITRLQVLLGSVITKFGNNASIFDKLNRMIVSILSKQLKHYSKDAETFVKKLLLTEASFIHTNRDDFLGHQTNEQKQPSVSLDLALPILVKVENYSKYETKYIKFTSRMHISAAAEDSTINGYEIKFCPHSIVPSNLNTIWLAITQGLGQTQESKGATAEKINSKLKMFFENNELFPITKIHENEKDKVALREIERKSSKKPIIETRNLVVDYLRLVRQNLKSQIPKIVYHFVVDSLAEYCEKDFRPNMTSHSADELKDWLLADPKSTNAAKALQNKKVALDKALDVINRCDLTNLHDSDSEYEFS